MYVYRRRRGENQTEMLSSIIDTEEGEEGIEQSCFPVP
jgi:hypothetical protein